MEVGWSSGADSRLRERVRILEARGGFGLPWSQMGVGFRWGSEFVGSVVSPNHFPAVVVDVVVAACAYQHEVVDVGAAALEPFFDVVGLAPYC